MTTTPLHISILGAGSFVARAFGHAAERAGHQVVRHGRTSFDVTDPDARLPGSTDVVVFLAQDRNYTTLDTAALKVFDVNTVGVLNAAIKARDAGARGVVYTSTGNVYAPSFEPLAEDAPLHRGDIYSTSKIFAEQILELVENEVAVVRPRLFGAYGPDQTIGLLAGIADRVRSGRPVTLAPRYAGVPDEGFRVSLTHVDDVAAALVELCERIGDVPLPPALNLAAPTVTSIAEIAGLVGETLGRSPIIEHADTPRSFDLVADTTLAQATLPTTYRTVREGIPAALGGTESS